MLPEATPLEAVCTIFETLNRTGRPLSPFELISALAFAGGHSLYDLWNGALEQHPIRGDFGVKPYYLLQCIALRLGEHGLMLGDRLAGERHPPGQPAGADVTVADQEVEDPAAGRVGDGRSQLLIGRRRHPGWRFASM